MKHKVQAIVKSLQQRFMAGNTIEIQMFVNILKDQFIMKFIRANFKLNDSPIIQTIVTRDDRMKFSFTMTESGIAYQPSGEDQVDLKPFIDVMIERLDLKDQFRCSISVKELEAYPEDCNPFHHDLYSMGCQISGGWMAMYDKHPGKDRDGRPYPEPNMIVLVNTRTGRRFELDMSDANTPVIKKEES